VWIPCRMNRLNGLGERRLTEVRYGTKTLLGPVTDELHPAGRLRRSLANRFDEPVVVHLDGEPREVADGSGDHPASGLKVRPFRRRPIGKGQNCGVTGALVEYEEHAILHRRESAPGDAFGVTRHKMFHVVMGEVGVSIGKTGKGDTI
jgi:hypothetical protein